MSTPTSWFRSVTGPAFGTLLILMTAPSALAQFEEPETRVIRTLRAVQQGEFFGYVANRVADTDGDGFAELIVGAPYADGGAGRGYLVSVATGAVLATFYGEPNEYFGAAVNDAGDLDGDGVHDVVLGGTGLPFSGPTNRPGRVAAYSGATHQLLWSRTGEVLNDFFGYTVAGLHADANGDGHPDVLVGAIGQDSGSNNGGAAYVLSGADGSTLLRIGHPAAGARLGSCVVSAADHDGDGIRDLLAGAYRLNAVGGAELYSSATGAPLRTLTPDSPTAGSFGWFFCDGVLDANGDGVEDAYVTDFNDAGLGAGTGQAYLFSGADGSVLRRWGGENGGDGFGIGRSAGDVDCDGRGDLFIAAYTYGSLTPAVGKGYVLSGGTGRILQVMTGTVMTGQLGYDAGTLGDVDADGRTDFFLTGRGDDAASVTRSDGIIYVIAGNPPIISGDMNCDGRVTFRDIDTFVLALGFPGGVGWLLDCPWDVADCNGDGEVDFRDINPFVSQLGKSCP